MSQTSVEVWQTTAVGGQCLLSHGTSCGSLDLMIQQGTAVGKNFQ